MRKIPLAWEFEGNCIRCTSHLPRDNGYVYVHGGEKRRSIPRRILFKRHGVLPREMVSRHSCDNRWCINPNHIEIGKQVDNVRDMVMRERSPKGEQCSWAKLTTAQMLEIRNSSVVQSRLANRYGVSQSMISMIKNSKRWA